MYIRVVTLMLAFREHTMATLSLHTNYFCQTKLKKLKRWFKRSCMAEEKSAFVLVLRVFFVVAVSRAANCARVRALLSTAAHGGITERRRQKILKQVLLFRRIRRRKRRSAVCFFPSQGDCCQAVSQRSFSPSRPRLAWESIFKCRDLNLNG